VASKPYVEIEDLDRQSLVKALASLGVERVAVFSEQWDIVFAHPTESDGRAMQSVAVSVSSFLDAGEEWVLLQKENSGSLIVVRTEGRHVVAEGVISPENVDVVVLLSRLLAKE